MSDDPHDVRLAKALADLSKQDKPNFLRTATKYKVNRTTLRRRFNGTQVSVHEFHSESIQRLTDAQEEEVIKFINKLTDRNLPPTSQIVKSVAEEMSNSIVSHNWVSHFTRRHQDCLYSGYLYTIDNAKKKADNISLITQFYNQVSNNI
jgi:hypothetical protein